MITTKVMHIYSITPRSLSFAVDFLSMLVLFGIHCSLDIQSPISQDEFCISHHTVTQLSQLVDNKISGESRPLDDETAKVSFSYFLTFVDLNFYEQQKT